MLDKILRDPFLKPSMPLRNRAGRAIWHLVWTFLFRPTPRPMHTWRCFLLRCFGATIGKNCHIYPSARIWAPWNLICDDVVALAEGTEVYNPCPIVLGSHCVVSQNAYLCGASHNYDDPDFPMVYAPIRVGAYAWIGARATVLMGIEVGDGAVLGLGSIATRSLDPWTVYAGIPARQLRTRARLHASPAARPQGVSVAT